MFSFSIKRKYLITGLAVVFILLGITVLDLASPVRQFKNNAMTADYYDLRNIYNRCSDGQITAVKVEILDRSVKLIEEFENEGVTYKVVAERMQTWIRILGQYGRTTIPQRESDELSELTDMYRALVQNEVEKKEREGNYGDAIKILTDANALFGDARIENQIALYETYPSAP